MNTKITRELLEKLSSLSIHLKTNKLEFSFPDREPIINDYQIAKKNAMMVQVWNIIYRYEQETRKELEIFKVED